MLTSNFVFPKYSRLLVASPDRYLRVQLSDLLLSFGYAQPVLVDTVNGLLECARQQHLNLILFDEDLPMLTSVEVSRMIRSDAKIQRVPQLLVIVAQAIRSMVNEARDAGIDAMITKPVVPLRIMRTIAQLQFVRFAA